MKTLLISSLLPLLPVIAGLPSTAVAQSDPERAIELPNYTVRGDRVIPPPEKWLYGRIGPFEVLSKASERATRHFLEDFVINDRIISSIWPPIRTVKPTSPVTILICDRGNLHQAFQSKKIEFEELPLEHEIEEGIFAKSHRGRSAFFRQGEEAALLADLSPPDGPTGLDPYRLFGTVYTNYLISRIDPRLPRWCGVGVSRLFADVDYFGNTASIGKAPPTMSATRSQIAPIGANPSLRDNPYSNPTRAPIVAGPPRGGYAILKFDEFFKPSSKLPPGWSLQCHVFAHMCIFGRGGRYQEGFVAFADRTARHEPTEEIFEECFGMRWKDMAVQLRGYTEFTDYRSLRFKFKDDTLKPPAIELREATQGEIGRIKGDAFRLAGRVDAGANELVVAYLRGERDPQLLAALGLHEYSRAKYDRASRFLEEAYASGEVLPSRAYSGLARVRLLKADNDSTAPQEQRLLAAADVSRALKPLFAARERGRATMETYQLIAEIWGRSAVAPTAANLEVLTEGMRLFPRAELICEVAGLHLGRGSHETARSLVRFARKTTKDAALLSRLDAIALQLPSEPVAEPETAPARPPEAAPAGSS